jgi:hypothetical protein
VRRHAKASSADSKLRQAGCLGRFARGAFATPVVSGDATESSAPSSVQALRSLALASVAIMAATLAIAVGPASAAAPVVTIEPAAEIGFTSAKAEGSVNPGEKETSYHFEYATQEQFTNSEWGEASWAGDGSIPDPAGNAPVAVEASLPNLQPGTVYHLRLVAGNEDGGGDALTSIFETEAATAPAVAIEPPAAVSFTAATISGTVDPEGGNVDPLGGPVPIPWELQVTRTDEPDAWQFAEAGVIEGAEAETSGPITVQANLSSLQNNTKYLYRLVASRGGEVATSSSEEFETEAVSPPGVTAPTASAVTGTEAHFSGEVTPGNADPAFDSACRFDYVTDAQFQIDEFVGAAQIGCDVNPVTGAGATAVAADAAGLEPNTIYHLRLRAENQGGTTAVPAALTFTTEPILPLVGQTFVSQVGVSGAIFNAKINPGGVEAEYRFQYVTQADFEADGFNGALETPEVALGAADNGEHTASATVTGLQPGTAYRYRVLATNEVGTTEGPDRGFHTSATPGTAPDTCPNAALRAELHATALPNCRAWEMVSPPNKNGSDIIYATSRVQAARTESPGLPMAAMFSSLGAFGDAQGTGVSVDYISQRTLAPGTNGWGTHAVTPYQEPMSFFGAVQGLFPKYDGDMSPDLTAGAFRAWSPLSSEPNIQEVVNLYARTDLRQPGPGSYQLLTNAVTPLPQISAENQKPVIGAGSENFEHVVYESKLNLTPGTSGTNYKAYKSDQGVPRLITNGSPACPGGATAAAPCSSAGTGVAPINLISNRFISTDGSRVDFTTPMTAAGLPNSTPGFASKLFQLDDQGTASPTDDAVMHLSASERPAPEATRGAAYWDSSASNDRVFFSTGEALTNDATPVGGGEENLYLWDRQETNETQQLAVDATGGTFTLTAHTQPSFGSGKVTNGSNKIESTTGAFSVGQTVSGTGIPSGATVTKVEATKLTLSQVATASGSGVALKASMQATTPPLAFDASAAQVQAALESLHFSAPFESLPLLGAGNVSVTGGPGSAGAVTPYSLTFTGALAGVNVMQVTAGGAALTGGAGTAVVATAAPVQNLTFIGARIIWNAGVFGASEDGHRLYFSSREALVPGAPSSPKSHSYYYWQDADGVPGGTLSYVGADPTNSFTNTYVNEWALSPKTSRVTPDGKHLIFQISDGSELAPGYDHGSCIKQGLTQTNSGMCDEIYLYSAETSTPTEPDIVCASCRPSGEPATANAFISNIDGIGASGVTKHMGHNVSDDGSRVFFSTAERLVGSDTNGKIDAYEFDAASGTVHLLSSGTDSSDSYFLEASASGNDVFIGTREALVGWDIDEAYDLYDARVGGGVPNPVATAADCAGESCRPARADSPATSPNGSGSLVGPGDPLIRRPKCSKGKRAVRRGGKTRCVKKHRQKGQSQKRNASNSRRASR